MRLEGEEKKLVIKAIRSTSIKQVEGEDTGIIEAYVSIFGNVDSYGDIVEPGAFKDAVDAFNADGRYPKGIWAHDWSFPIAKTLEMREDERGLYIKAQFILSVEKAREAYDLIKSGVMTDFSFGYEINESDIDNRGFRHLRKITIYEWSPVLVGANNQATLIDVKSAAQEQTVESEERDVPEETPEGADETIPVPTDVETPEPETPPTEEKPEGDELNGDNPTPPEGTSTEGQGAGATETPEEKALDVKVGRTLSAKNISLIKGAMVEIDQVADALSDIKATFEALIASVESEDDKDAGAVDTPTKSTAKILLKDAREAVKATNRVIVKLKAVADN